MPSGYRSTLSAMGRIEPQIYCPIHTHKAQRMRTHPRRSELGPGLDQRLHRPPQVVLEILGDASAEDNRRSAAARRTHLEVLRADADANKPGIRTRVGVDALLDQRLYAAQARRRLRRAPVRQRRDHGRARHGARHSR